MQGCPARDSLAAQVEAWGYPRKITEHERESGTWFVNGLGVLWLVPPVPEGYDPPEGFDARDVLCIHGIGRPGRWAQALSPDTARLIEALGRSLGARSLRALNGPPSMKFVKRYLRRYGWLEDEWGAYKVLKGVSE